MVMMNITKSVKVLCGAHDSKEKGLYSGYLRTQSACEKVKTSASSLLSSAAREVFILIVDVSIVDNIMIIKTKVIIKT